MNDTERELRDAVRSYGEGVQPADRLGEIRRATAARPRRTQAWLLVGGVALATAAVVLGFAVLVGPGNGDGGDDAPVATPTAGVTVYEVREVGERLWLYPVRVSTPDAGDPAGAVQALLNLEAHNPLGSCGTGELKGIRMGDDVITVSLGELLVSCDMSTEGTQAALQQLVWTVHDATGSDAPVQVIAAGKPFSLQPYTADPNALSPVLLDSPADGATVESPLTVEGRGNTFEGNVQWQVLSGGDVVDKGFETAGTMGDFRPFTFTVDLEPGDYTLRVFALSMEDGSLFAEDTTSVTVD